jgi:hypothetical protein
VGLLAAAFMVTLGVVVGTRLSSDAIAVLVGVIAGVAASIPCALLLMAVTRRREPEREESYAEECPGPYRAVDRPAPPVIVVAPGNATPQQFLPWASGQAYGASPYGALAPTQRQFRIMGYDGDEPAEERASWPH